MSHLFSDTPFSIIRGNSFDVVKQLQTSVDCVVTSPPYFSQRHYGDSPEEFGNEASVREYVNLLVGLFSSISLAPWGSVWVNLNDKRGKHGELLGVPERFLIAMQESGFFLVDKVIWAKEVLNIDGTANGHCMIDPARHRLNGNGFEYLLRFVKNTKTAWTDLSAIRVPRLGVEDIRYRPEGLMQCHTSLEGRTPANVWRIPVTRTGLEHYGMFPPALVERPIAMTCPEFVTEKGPRERIVQWEVYQEKVSGKSRKIGKYSKDSVEMSGRHDTAREYVPRKPKTVGWTLSDLPREAGTVLDPFAGTSTVGEVAIKLGRRYIGVELYDKYADLGVERCNNATALLSAHNARTKT